MPPVQLRAGIDSGGTFTDVVAVRDDGRITVRKLPSTPHDPAEATVAGWRAVAGADADTDGSVGELRHGTTVATNALLQGSGARTVLVTTDGFTDVLAIGRQRRPDLYDPFADRVAPLVPAERRIGVRERRTHTGAVVVPLDDAAVAATVDAVIAAGPEAVAVVLLHSWADAGHERRVADALRDALPGHVPVVASCDAAREFREYERTSTTVLHAWLAPGTAGYLHRLADDPTTPPDTLVMRSAGGLGRAADVAQRPADALLSGPAAGALAAAVVAADAGFAEAIAFDMGGTSTDVCLLVDGRADVRSSVEIAGHPCLVPSLAVHTVGAGGGSVAAIDAGGALVVGPASAGADPGPACYGRGGTVPTVTDANAVLGRLGPLAAGTLVPDRDAASAALATLGPAGAPADAFEAAHAVVDVVEATMEQALRVVSVQRGVDPADAAIVAFGGAGALHAASLRRAIGARAVLVPPLAGVLSAVGLLAAPVRADRSRTAPTPLSELDPTLFDDLAAAAVEEVAWAGSPVVSLSIDCRYDGQSHELHVPVAASDPPAAVARRFAAEHERRNGFTRDDAEVWAVTLRARAVVPSPVQVRDVLRPAAADRRRRFAEPVVGPALVVEDDASIWIPAGDTATCDAAGNVVITGRSA